MKPNMKILSNKVRLSNISALLSIFTLVAFHIPFFRHAASYVESGLNAVVIMTSLVVIMLLANYFVYYFLLWTGRIVGKCILAFSFIADAISLYFINTYDVMLDDSMMGNVLNTRFSEASGFFSPAAVIYVIFLGVVPCIYVILRKIDFGSIKRAACNIGGSIIILLLILAVNLPNWTFINNNQSVLGSYLLPWSYTVNTIRYKNQERQRNKEEILLPDACFSDFEKAVCVLVIGESARRDHFSLYGYERQTNPLLENDEVIPLIANSAATYTILGVKAILDHRPTDELYEILPNYLFRAGADVIWRTSNWGESKLKIDKVHSAQDLHEMYPEADERYDGILLEGLSEEIKSSGKDKIFVVLHTSTSHGPAYSTLYPKEFEAFTPVCTSTELSKVNREELVNAYDNTILYTDFLIHSVICQLKSLPENWRKCMLYVSDHGESLGENGLFMHGVTMSMAPKEQFEIPFIVWTGDGTACLKDIAEVGQYHVFHSVMDFLGAESPVFDSALSVFID